MTKKTHRKLLALTLMFLLIVTTCGGLTIIAPLEVEAAAQTISSSSLSVQVDDAFPRVIQYTDIASGAVMYGQEDTLSQIKINGTLYTPTVTSTRASDKITYTLTVSSINVTITMEFKVVGNTLEMNVTNINDSGSTKVYKLEFPDYNLVSVRNTQSGAAMAYNENFVDNDTFSTVSAKAVDSSPLIVGHSIINTNSLAASIETSMTSQNSYIQTIDKGTYKRTGLWAYEFFYRGPDDAVTELPWAKVIVVGDQNSDGAVDWQDGAIAYRSIMDPLPGTVNLAQKNIFCNIFCGYWGRNPWTWEAALDFAKRQALATDKFPQIIQAKTSHEGIDGWPSYGDASDVLGGNTQLNWFINEGANWNIYVGTHTNSHEAYPDSPFWSGTPLTDALGEAWNMVDREAKHIDQTQYWANGTLSSRYDIHQAAFPNMKFQYLDVELGNGTDARWQAYKSIKKFKQHGWQLFTEFPMGSIPGDPYKGTKYISWAHNYLMNGNSNIRRFIMNNVTMLGAGDISYQNVLGKGYADNYGYLGWLGSIGTVNSVINEFWRHMLADTYLKNFKILKIYNDPNNNSYLTALFENGVKSVYDGSFRKIYRDNILYASLNDSSQEIFLPWEAATEDKIYTYSSIGGQKTWTLPNSWNGLTTLKLYKLTQTNGREFANDVTVTNNQVTINYTAGQGYILTKTAGSSGSIVWGDGSIIKDFEFNSGGFAYWNRSSTSDVSIVTGDNNGLQISGNNENYASQTITGLTSGKSYAITACANISGGKKAVLGVKDYGGQEVTDSIDHNVSFTADRLDNWPKLKVNFTVPPGHTSATVYLKGMSSTGGYVQFDDIRFLEEANPYGGAHYFFDGFEDTHWAGPFVHATNDVIATLSKTNAPYTTDTITGNQSLKIMHWNANTQTIHGTIVKTLPNLLKLKPNTTYKLSFNYKPMYASAAGWSYRIYSEKGTSTLLKNNLSASQDQVTAESVRFTTGGYDDYSLEFVNDSATNADIVIDDITVDTVVDDTDTGFAYSDGWSDFSSSDRFNGTAHACNDSVGGQTAKVTFYGSNVKLYMRKSYDAQKINIHVDNQADETVDLYLSSLQNQVLVCEKSSLENSLHTLTITTTGTKNIASSGLLG